MHEDTDADVFVLFGLLDIGDAELFDIARGALANIGIRCPAVTAVTSVRGAPKGAPNVVTPEVPKGKEPGFLTQLWCWIKSMFWSVKK